MKNKVFPKRCQKCRYKCFSITLGSPDKEIWHCRFGFSPGQYCLELAEYNENIIREESKDVFSSFDSISLGVGIQLTFDF